MLAFFSLEKQGEFYDLLCDDTWKSKLAYLVDIFDDLNSSMLGKNKNLFSSTDKMRALQEKLKMWSLRIQKRTFDSFVISLKRIIKK